MRIVDSHRKNISDRGREERRMAEITSLGLGKTMEQKLHAVGIYTAEELIEIGSEEAVFRLKMKYPSTCVVILYHLQAAIEKKEINQLSADTKEELKTFFRKL